MTDLTDIAEELRRRERDRQDRRASHDRALVSLFVAEQAIQTKAAERFADKVIGWCAALGVVLILIEWLGRVW